MGQRPKVVLLIDTATTWGAGLIEGIADYAHSIADWQLFLGPRGKYDRLSIPSTWDGDGVIARVTTQDLADQIVERGIPAVNVSWYRFRADVIPQCTCDEVKVGEMAAAYFLDRGFRQFAYCASYFRPDFIDRCGAAFVESLAKRSLHCHTFTPASDPENFSPPPAEQARLADWLKRLPKPCALLAFDSVQARQVTDACLLAEVDVPYEIAVLGGEHDHLSCTISKPELSSIDHAPRRVGRTAAELLARLMAGQALPETALLLPPSRTITRQSTDTVAVNDELIAGAVQFIKENSHKRIQISDILKAVPISRRALEKSFRQLLGRSPAEEIRRIRVDHAVQLLCDTAWPMPQIARACGFDRAELLTRAFRNELRTTPSEFRRQHLKSGREQRASTA